MELLTVAIDKPDDLNVILGQSHFIKTVEDIHEVLAGASPQLRFGIAFCESSGPRLVRRSGNATHSSTWPRATPRPSARVTRSSCSYARGTR